MLDPLHFSIKKFEDLELMELYRILHLRDVVFVVGQKITTLSEVDGEDPKYSHVLLTLNQTLIGTARLRIDTTPISVGRIAIHTDFQGKGYGRKLMQYIDLILEGKKATMHAQAHLKEWYTSLGWEARGDLFEEAEIPHIEMIKNGS